MKQKQLIFKAGCALVLCASLALPGALAAWDDFQLLHTPSVRPQAAGALSYHARELPTAYALYRRRQLFGAQALEQSAEPSATAPFLTQATNALHDAGVLSEALYTKALTRLSAANTASQSHQDGFSFSRCSESSQGDSPTSIESEWIDATGIVTQYRITDVSCQDDPQALLEAYQVYLGLQTVSDWQVLSPDLFSDGTAAAWSSEGQVYIYCCVNKDGLQLGAASFSPAEFSFSGNILETATG